MHMPSSLKAVLLVLLLILLSGWGCDSRSSSEENIAAAQEYIDNDELNKAVIELKNALQQAPDNALARRLLGEVYLTMGDGASAQKELERAATLGEDPNFTQPLLARALLNQRDYDDVLEIDPLQDQLLPAGKATVHSARGMALIAQNKLDDAGREFEQGLAQDAGSIEVLTGLAWLATSRQQMDQAREYLDRVFAIDPGYAKAWSLLGNIERAGGNPEAALAAYSKAADGRHANPMDILNRISINISLGNLDVARTEIAAQRKQGSRVYLLDYLEGLIIYQERNYKDARPLFERVLEQNPSHEGALLYAGTCNLQEGNLEKARYYLSSYNAINPDFIPALKMLAVIAMKDGDYKDVQQYIRPVLAQEPNDVFSLRLLSGALVGDKQVLEGLNVLQQVVELNPDSAGARMALGMGMIQQGKLESGLNELEASRELDPDIQQTSLFIISTYLNNNEKDKALDAALTLLGSHPDSVAANATLGMVYLTRQENDKAAQAFRDTLALESDNVTANNGLATLAVKAGQPEEAKAYYRKILQNHPGELKTSMNLAYLSALDGNIDEMKAVLEKSIEANPGALLPRLALSRYYSRQADFDKVVDILEPVKLTAKGDFNYLKLLSEAQYRTGDYVNARSNLEALVEIAPDNASVHYLLVMSLLQLRINEGIRGKLERVLILDPEHVGARVLSIELMIIDGNASAARKNIEILKKQSGDTVDVFLLEGRLASSTGDYKAAVSAYQRAYEIKETNINLLKLEEATWNSGDQGAAIDLLTSWLVKLPADQASSVRLASRYMAMGKESEAISVYYGMLKQAPDSVPTMNNLAWLLQDSDPKQALKFAEKAHLLAPESHSVTDTLAVVLSKNEPSRAQSLIREALVASPGNPIYLYHQALIYQRAGKPEQALEIVKKLLKDTPDFPEVEEARQLMKELGG